MESMAQLQERMRGMFGELLGIRLLEAGPEGLKAELLVREELCTLPGTMHGGAIMAFADHLGGAATALNLPEGKGTTTIESKTNFFAPGKVGEMVFAECTALHRGGTTMVWQTRITNASGRLMALVTQTQLVLEPRSKDQPEG